MSWAGPRAIFVKRFSTCSSERRSPGTKTSSEIIRLLRLLRLLNPTTRTWLLQDAIAEGRHQCREGVLAASGKSPRLGGFLASAPHSKTYILPLSQSFPTKSIHTILHYHLFPWQFGCKSPLWSLSFCNQKNYHILTQLWPFQCHGSRRLQKLSRFQRSAKKQSWRNGAAISCSDASTATAIFSSQKKPQKPRLLSETSESGSLGRSTHSRSLTNVPCNMSWNVSKMVRWKMYPPNHMSSHNESKLAPCKGSNQKACPFFPKFKVSF